MARALCCHDEWPLSEKEATRSSTARQRHWQRHQFNTCQSRTKGRWCVCVCVCEMSTVLKSLWISSRRLLISSCNRTSRGVARGQVVTGSCLGLFWLFACPLWPHPVLHHFNPTSVCRNCIGRRSAPDSKSIRILVNSQTPQRLHNRQMIHFPLCVVRKWVKIRSSNVLLLSMAASQPKVIQISLPCGRCIINKTCAPTPHLQFQYVLRKWSLHTFILSYIYQATEPRLWLPVSLPFKYCQINHLKVKLIRKKQTPE